MSGRIPARAANLAAALLAAIAVSAVAAATAGAAVIYDNTPTPHPRNIVSNGFEATSTSEFGGLVEFAGTARTSPTVLVTMSSWACQNLKGGAACATSGKATFLWPITVNVYELGEGNEPGALIASKTQMVNVPYRPSANNKKCTPNGEGVVGFGPQCFHGLAFKVPFELAGAKLPAKAIVSVAYNTTDYGNAPTHEADVGEDSLNLGLTEPPETPSVGTNPLPDNIWVNSSWSEMYGGTGTVGTFSIASGWTGYQPVYKIKAKSH